MAVLVENSFSNEKVTTDLHLLKKNVQLQSLDFDPTIHGGATEAEQQRRIQKLDGKKLLWLTCHYTADLYDGIKGPIQGVVDKGVKLYIVFGNT